jgi:hypothetical protein
LEALDRSRCEGSSELSDDDVAGYRGTGWRETQKAPRGVRASVLVVYAGDSARGVAPAAEVGAAHACTFTWVKKRPPRRDGKRDRFRGYQPPDLPQFVTEFCLYAHKGSAPFFLTTKGLNTLLDFPAVGAHSTKPEGFYAELCRVTGGRRVDLYGRRKIAGFESWGLEAPPNDEAEPPLAEDSAKELL